MLLGGWGGEVEEEESVGALASLCQVLRGRLWPPLVVVVETHLAAAAGLVAQGCWGRADFWGGEPRERGAGLRGRRAPASRNLHFARARPRAGGAHFAPPAKSRGGFLYSARVARERVASRARGLGGPSALLGGGARGARRPGPRPRP